MVGMEMRTWVATLVLVALSGRGGADYVWDGEQWQWQDVPAPAEDTEEGSGGGVAAAGGGYRDDEDDSDAGSGEEEDLYSRENDGGAYNTRHRIQEESINVDSDEEIDPNEMDIGFHDEPTASPPPPVQQATPSSPGPGKGPPTPTEEPHKTHQGGETNFFAQPGILAAVVGGTVVGLLCTILLVMLIVYRMRKADEGSYALNEPKRSPNVHSYLKAPTREFFA